MAMPQMMGQQPMTPTAQQAPVPGQELDNEQTAGQPQLGGDDADTATFETMCAGLKDHIYGKGEKGIVDRLAQTEPAQLARVIGEMTFALVQEAAKQAEAAQRELDMDILMGVATEVIDDISELADASGIEGINDQVKHDALLVTNQIYVESSNPTDDERNMAKQTLADQKQTGQVDQATAYIQKRGAEEGADPFDVAGMKSARPGMMEAE